MFPDDITGTSKADFHSRSNFSESMARVKEIEDGEDFRAGDLFHGG